MYPTLSEISEIGNSFSYLISVDSIPPQPNPKLPIITIVLTIIFFPIAIYFISIGSLTINLCPMNPHLPIWMILLGVFMIMDRAVSWILELNMYRYKMENSKPDREMKVLIQWESKKAGHRLRISKYLSVTISGLLFFAMFGTYCLPKKFLVPDSDQCNEVLVYSSAFFCSLILVSFSIALLISFIVWIFLLGLKCFCA